MRQFLKWLWGSLLTGIVTSLIAAVVYDTPAVAEFLYRYIHWIAVGFLSLLALTIWCWQGWSKNEEEKTARTIVVASGSGSVSIGGSVTNASITIGRQEQGERIDQNQRGELELKLVSIGQIGHRTSANRDGISAGFYARIRVRNKAKRIYSIDELQVCEQNGPKWRIEETFLPDSGQSLSLPLQILPGPSLDFCIRAYSPTVFPKLPATVGKLELKAEDQDGHQYQLWLTPGEVQVLP